jgi:hypothetical protein
MAVYATSLNPLELNGFVGKAVSEKVTVPAVMAPP